MLILAELKTDNLNAKHAVLTAGKIIIGELLPVGVVEILVGFSERHLPDAGRYYKVQQGIG